MICRLVLVIHQRQALDPKRRGGRNLRIGIVTEREIDSTVACPFAQRGSAAHEVTGLAAKRAAAMPTDYVRHHSGLRRQLNRLRKVARGYFDLMSARSEFRNQCMKERNMRRVGEIDPDAHQL